MKQPIALFLSLLLCLGCLVPAFAADAEPLQAENFLYRISDDGTAEIVRYVNTSEQEAPKTCVIPEQIDGRAVTAIAPGAFSTGVGYFLQKLVIPKTVLTIPDCFLQNSVELQEIAVDEDNPNYSSLNGVLFNKDQTRLIAFPASKKGMRYTVPNTVKTIAPCAFSRAKVWKIKLQSSVETIEKHAFDFAQTEQIVLSEGLKEIGAGAFYQKYYTGKLNRILIPKSVTKIGKLAFGQKAVYRLEPYTVYGYAGSYIETYCKKANIDFVAVDLPAPKSTAVVGGALCAEILYRKELNSVGVQVLYYTRNGQKITQTFYPSRSGALLLDDLEAGKTTFKIRLYRNYAGVNAYSPWVTRTVMVKPKAL